MQVLYYGVLSRTSFMLSTALYTRPVQPGDRYRLDRLLSTAGAVHSHIDWQPLAEWLAKRPFYLALIGEKLVGALAAPPELPEVVWLRLAAVADGFPAEAVLDLLWSDVGRALSEAALPKVSCMVLETWITPHLQRWGFHLLDKVVVLRRERQSARAVAQRAARIEGLRLRPATAADIEAITELDNTAFAPPWQYSQTVIRQAMAEATLATVAEIDGELAGYQISTRGREGGHLARLAVRPQRQGWGIGRALTAHMIDYFDKRGTARLTVNTQQHNTASLAVYRALGFELTSEHYEVWQSALKS